MTGWMKRSGYSRHARKCPRGKSHVRCVFKAQGPEVAPLSAATGASTLGWKLFLPCALGSILRVPVNKMGLNPCSTGRTASCFGKLNGTKMCSGLPRRLSGKESACQCRRQGFDPWVEKIPWRRKWQPTQYSCLGYPVDRDPLQALVHGVRKSQIRLSH